MDLNMRGRGEWVKVTFCVIITDNKLLLDLGIRAQHYYMYYGLIHILLIFLAAFDCLVYTIWFCDQVYLCFISLNLVFWNFVKAHLGKLEEERFISLQKATTDAGKGQWSRGLLCRSAEVPFHVSWHTALVQPWDQFRFLGNCPSTPSPKPT